MLLGHGAASNLNGRHFIDTAESLNKELSWFFKKAKLHFQPRVCVHLLLCFGKIQKTAITWTVCSWPVKRMFPALAVKIDFFFTCKKKFPWEIHGKGFTMNFIQTLFTLVFVWEKHNILLILTFTIQRRLTYTVIQPSFLNVYFLL